MKRHLLPSKTQYKANLHCHSTVSDGRFTPEELKELYKSRGYSVLAFTDHNVLVPHTDLKDESFIPLTSTEIDICEPVDNWYVAKTYHLNFYSKDENLNEFVPVDRIYDINVMNDLIKQAKDKGFVVAYNHARWSMQTAVDYLGLKGVSMFEIYNSCSDIEKMNGCNEGDFESMLLAGNMVFPTAVDDNHNFNRDVSDPYNDSFRGWTMLCMDKLDYNTVLETLEKGDFYASTGPEIKEFSIEDGVFHIECSPCKVVTVRTDSRVYYTVRSDKDDITKADFKLNTNFKHRYIRLEIYDEYRNKAFTRAYLENEIK